MWCFASQKKIIVSRAQCAGALSCWNTNVGYLQRCDGWLAAVALTATPSGSGSSSRSHQDPHTRLEQPNFDTATDTISDLLQVGRVRKSRSAETSRFLAGSLSSLSLHVYAVVLQVNWRRYRKKKSFIASCVFITLN